MNGDVAPSVSRSAVSLGLQKSLPHEAAGFGHDGLFPHASEPVLVVLSFREPSPRITFEALIGQNVITHGNNSTALASDSQPPSVHVHFRPES